MSAPAQNAAPRPPAWLSGLQRANASRAAMGYGQMTLARAVQLVLWAQSLREFPTVREIVERWGCCRASAYRWRAALAAAYGITPPPNPPGEACEERMPGRTGTRARRYA